ncbi:KduI/IolB family protein [Aliiruegeria haliotis]|uniref:KduI/IolB family protein n=1 Tax=Aliiruegeria haliotis TaxID=1280846 RepID=A0A2T0REE6_9RHOB|nr:5-deoxy-glucuronate isomerase [Aliiruegeria haliotis]PRY19533.1 KduI/IolB family protein [Aliiruegeria haliotis]
MQIIDKDDTRMIDLPGVGPCPRPVDIDESVTGFKTLKSLRIYRFQPGPTIEGESEIDEVFVVPVNGKIGLSITGAHPVDAELSREGPARALYMTPDHAYRLTPQTETLVAYSRAEAEGRVPCQAVEGPASEGLAEKLAFRSVNCAVGASLPLGGAAETLCHVAKGSIRVADKAVNAGQTLALQAGEMAELTATADAQLLVVTA